MASAGRCCKRRTFEGEKRKFMPHVCESIVIVAYMSEFAKAN